VGGLLYPNREKIFSLRPTLILASPLARYPWPGRIPVFTVGMENVRETVAGLRFLGRRLGREEKFLWWLSQMEKEKNPGRPMQVLFLFGLNKTFSAGRGSYVHDLVEFSGARNLSVKGRSAWPCLSREFVLASDPDRLVVAVPTEVYEDRFRWMERYRRDPFWGLLKAVKSHHLYFVDERNFLIPGPRFVEALRVLNCCWEI
jgi:ABC-type Fe3+-hydroxamate transport system substrate-binding protein